jgi:hypothetical protein
VNPSVYRLHDLHNHRLLHKVPTSYLKPGMPLHLMIWFDLVSIVDTFSTVDNFSKVSLILKKHGVNPIDWTAKRQNLECRSSEF